MAKRPPARRAKPTRNARKPKARRPSGKRPIKRAKPGRRAAARKKPARKARRVALTGKVPRLERARRTLDDDNVPTPPSSLDMRRLGTAARSGREGIAERLLEHKGMSSAITGGDADVDVEDAYFTGDEAPGGDNTTPDQDVVDDIGKALGVEYADNEELKSSEKVVERDRHRWELDPASSEDYRDRKR